MERFFESPKTLDIHVRGKGVSSLEPVSETKHVIVGLQHWVFV